jgi:hypothetical protein
MPSASWLNPYQSGSASRGWPSVMPPIPHVIHPRKTNAATRLSTPTRNGRAAVCMRKLTRAYRPGEQAEPGGRG